MLRDVERASNPWGKPQSERADWAAELGVRSSSRAIPRPSTCTGSGALRRSTSARAGPPSRRPSCSSAPASTSRSSARARAAPAIPRRRIGNEYVFQAFAQQNVETLNEAGRHEDRRQLPALLQHARQRVPGLRRQLRGDPPLRAARAARARGAPAAGARTTACRSPTTTPATWPATTTCSAPRASSSPRSASRSRCSARASRRSAAAPAARTCGWRSAASRSTRSACARPPGTGADTLAVACPYCTVMLDDGVQGAGEQLRVVDVATLLAESITASDADQSPER